MGNKEQFDLIISLGGNCAAACQCMCRNIRKFSLPFDFTFMANTRSIEYFAEGIQDGFKNLLLKENVVELKGDERGDEKEIYQYKDSYSEYRFIHLFGDDINKEGVYEKGYELIQKRIRRLYEKIDKAQKILILLGTSFAYDKGYAFNIKAAFEKLYPQKEFVYYFVMFSAEEDTEEHNENVHFIYAKRNINLYDFSGVYTNYEWKFLDNMTLTEIEKEKEKYINIKKLKKGIAIYLLPFIGTLFRIKLYILGFRLDLCLGKIRDNMWC